MNPNTNLRQKCYRLLFVWLHYPKISSKLYAAFRWCCWQDWTGI